jgi:hypothetical protein
MFNGQRTEVIFQPLTLNAIKFLPAVNGSRLMALQFEKLLKVNIDCRYILI